MINLYIGDFDYDSNYRPFLVDILKPFFPKTNLEKYHLTHIDLEIIHNKYESDFFLLPFCWNYYVETDTISVAERLIEEARENGKKILIWVTGDYYFPIPQFDNVIGFYTSPYESMQNVKTNALPVIITDPLLLIGRGSIEIQQYYILGVRNDHTTKIYDFTHLQLTRSNLVEMDFLKINKQCTIFQLYFYNRLKVYHSSLKVVYNEHSLKQVLKLDR
mgnify:CR=1 FL=1